MNTYKQMLINSGHYTLEQVATWTEDDCKAEYQEMTIGGES